LVVAIDLDRSDCSDLGGGSAPKDTPPEVLTAVVKRADLEDNVLAAGTLEAQKLVSVGAQASGQVNPAVCRAR
jgi:multidrug efflux pump subunit AcrA (membrane-fusion protein)